MKLSLGVIIAGLVVGTLVGPLETVTTTGDGFLTSRDFWVNLGEDTVRSFATSALAVLAIVAGAFGLPLLREAKNDDEPEPPAVPEP